MTPKGKTVTANSGTQKEQEKSASETAAAVEVLEKQPPPDAEAAVAAAAATVAVAETEAEAVVVEQNCSSEVRPKGPKEKTQRSVFGLNRRWAWNSGGSACRRRRGTRRRHGRWGTAAEEITARGVFRSRRSSCCWC